MNEPTARRRCLNLEALPDMFAVVQLSADAALPPWASEGAIVSVSRTADELSIVCADAAVPAGVRAQRGFRCLRVAGPLEFDVVGVLASLVAPLAEADVSVFSISTYNTDYLLVPAERLTRALEALQGAGHSVRTSEP